MAIKAKGHNYHIECDECGKEAVVYVPNIVGRRSSYQTRWRQMIDKIKEKGWRNSLDEYRQTWYNYCPDCTKAAAEETVEARLAATKLQWLKDEPT